MGRTNKRPYKIDDYTRHLRRINKMRKKEGLPPIKRRARKTNRPYRYTGKFVGASGGNRRRFKDKTVQEIMSKSDSPYIDPDGKSLCQKKDYQGQYVEWFVNDSKKHSKKHSKTATV
jgi:hypothetical protein